MNIKNLLAGLIFFSSIGANAGVTEGKVGIVFVHVFNDAFAFSMQSAVPNFASCAVSNRYTVSTSTQQGKNALSTILAAKAAGQTIQVVGTGTCTVNSGTEDINYIAVY